MAENTSPVKSFNPVKAAIALGLCFALGPSIAGFFVYKGILEAKKGDRFVTAKGLVERIERSDRGTLEIGFKVSGNDLLKANEQLILDTETIQTFIRNAGFDPKEITVWAPQVTDLQAQSYDTGSAPRDRYLIERTIAINSQKVDLLNSVSGKTGELISKGVTITRGTAQYYLDKFNDLRPGLVSEATKNALEVAKSFATTTGSQIGEIKRANQGVISMTSPNAPPGQDYDAGLGSIEKKIRVVTTIDFFLK